MCLWLGPEDEPVEAKPVVEAVEAVEVVEPAEVPAEEAVAEQPVVSTEVEAAILAVEAPVGGGQVDPAGTVSALQAAVAESPEWRTARAIPAVAEYGAAVGWTDVGELVGELARYDHIALLQWSLANLAQGSGDFRATFVKQERIGGRLKPAERIAVSHKSEPFSLLMEWRDNAGPIDKLLYVERPGVAKGKHKMVVHPTGLFFWIKSVERDPRGSDARKASRRTCDQFGFERTMRDLLSVYEHATARGDLQIEYLGESRVDGRRCVRAERRLPKGKGYPYARLVMDFDVGYLLPTRISCYDWKDKIIGKYVYNDLEFGCGLTDADFTAAANGL